MRALGRPARAPELSRVAHASAAELDACRYPHALGPRAASSRPSGTMPSDASPPGRPIGSRRGSAHAQDLSRVQVRAGHDQQPHLHRGRAQEPPRRLPGLRAPHDRRLARRRARRPLRERLYPHRPRRASRDTRSAAMPPMPGCRSIARRWAGSISIRPTTAWSAKDHVTLAWGRDFGDVSPLRGIIVRRQPAQAERGRGGAAARLTGR